MQISAPRTQVATTAVLHAIRLNPCEFQRLRVREHPMSDTLWVEVVVVCPVALADGLAAELVAAVENARHGVQIRKNEVVFWVDQEQCDTTLQDVRSCLTRLAKQGWKVSPDGVHIGADAPEDDWRNAWKTHFHVVQLTRQIVVVPPWEQHTPQAADIPIHLDPGHAFGTGAHASTQLVLMAMQSLADTSAYSPGRILDLGTGSGILAIAAAKFWPKCQIVATDIDPLAIAAAKKNVAHNGVDPQIRVCPDPLPTLDDSFFLLLANLEAHILHTLRDELLLRAAPGANLLLSGILRSQIQPIIDTYVAAGNIKLVDVLESPLHPDWRGAHLRRS